MFPSGSGSAAELRPLLEAVSSLPDGCDDSERIDRIRVLEELKAVAAAAQARETAAFAASQRAGQAAAGVPADRVGRGVAAQVGLARRVSPFHAARYLAWATILTTELPHTFAALSAGETSEWRAMLVARETVWLSREHRAVVDAELVARLESLGDRGTEREARRIAARLDPAGLVERQRRAESERRVSVRPAPDTMCYVSGLLPVAQGVAAWAALKREADSLIGQGDGRTRGQIMADTMVQRLTGQAVAADVPVEVNLVMSDRTLLAGDTEPVHLDGYGPIPAPVAREIVLRPSQKTPMWLRRLFTNPETGQLAAMETRRRAFTGNQRHFLSVRDQVCRTPWCEAPIRHLDHIEPVADGGPTSVANGQGLCQACNHAKQAHGWRTQITVNPGEVLIITPTRHSYRHRPPDPPGTSTVRSPLERYLAKLIAAA